MNWFRVRRQLSRSQQFAGHSLTSVVLGRGEEKKEETKGIDLYQLVNQGPCLIRRNGIDTPVDRLRWLVHSLGPLFQGSVLFGKLWWV
jgi:hypothetical protein